MPATVKWEVVFDATELDLLLELLEWSHRNLLIEIRHTDTREYKRTLLERLKVLEEILQRLRTESRVLTMLTSGCNLCCCRHVPIL